MKLGGIPKDVKQLDEATIKLEKRNMKAVLKRNSDELDQLLGIVM